MIELPPSHMHVRPWVLCERGTRWFPALCRFAPELMPDPLTASIIALDARQVRSALIGQTKAVLWWEAPADGVATLCDAVAFVSLVAPQVSQIVVGSRLSRAEQLVLAELRVAATIEHLEQIPQLSRLISAYFATDAGEQSPR